MSDEDNATSTTTVAPTTQAPTTSAPNTTIPPTTTPAPTTQAPTTTTAPTTTPAPTVTLGSDVRIVRIFYDGKVYRTEADEYIEIKNYGSVSQNIKGWILKDISDGSPSFTFPNYILEPGKVIRVYTNEVHPEWGGFSFGYGRAVWNNKDPDTAALYDAEGKMISQKSY